MPGAGRVPVPALDGDNPVLVGLHAFPRGHVEACLRQRQQCFAVLGKQVRLATSLAVVVLVAQREAPFEQPDVERRHAPARSAPARTACGAPRRPGTPRRPSRGPRTRCRTRTRTRNAPGTTGTGASASPARTSCAPRPRRHTDTIRGGTPPTHSKMSRSAWHAHSAFSPGISWLGPTFEYGKSSTNRRMRDTSPRYPAIDPARNRPAPRPDATPGRGSRPRAPRADSRRSCATFLVTVDSDTSAPYSSRRRSHIRVAVCRCLRHVQRSSASHCPNHRHVPVRRPTPRTAA